MLSEILKNGVRGDRSQATAGNSPTGTYSRSWTSMTPVGPSQPRILHDCDIKEHRAVKSSTVPFSQVRQQDHITSRLSQAELFWLQHLHMGADSFYRDLAGHKHSSWGCVQGKRCSSRMCPHKLPSQDCTNPTEGFQAPLPGLHQTSSSINKPVCKWIPHLMV